MTSIRIFMNTNLDERLRAVNGLKRGLQRLG